MRYNKMKKETTWQCESCGEKNPNAKKLCVKCRTAKKPWQMKEATRNKYCR